MLLMKRKTLIYNTGHLPILRHQIRWGIIFTLSLLTIFVFQLCLVVHAKIKEVNLSTAQNMVAIISLIFGLLLILVQILSIIKYVILIKKIKENGSYEQTDFSLNWSKGSLAKLIKLISYITLLLTSIFAFLVLTSALLEYFYFNEINYYLPAVLLFLFANNYSCKNIENQILLQQDS